MFVIVCLGRRRVVIYVARPVEDSPSALQEWAPSQNARAAPRILIPEATMLNEPYFPSSVPKPDEHVLVVAQRMRGKQQPHWPGVATGAWRLEGSEYIVEVCLPGLKGSSWRRSANIVRDCCGPAARGPAGDLVSAIAASLRVGASTEVLDCLRVAHNRQALPAEGSDHGGARVRTHVPKGADIMYEESGDNVPDAKQRWGRVLQRDADCAPALLKVAVLTSEGGDDVFSCSCTKWLCESAVVLAGILFERIGDSNSYQKRDAGSAVILCDENEDLWGRG